MAQVPNVLVMSPETASRLGIASVADLVAYAKKNPGKLNYGSGGNGSAGHLAGEMFKAQAGVFMVHIPYAGGNPAQLALLGGQVDLNFDNLAAASANIKAGKLQGARGHHGAALERDARGADDRRGRRARSASAASTSTPGSASSARPACRPRSTARLNKAFVERDSASSELEGPPRRPARRRADGRARPMRFAAFVQRNELAKYETGRQGLRTRGSNEDTPTISDSPMAFVQTDLQREVAALLVEALNLEIAADAIDPEAPLYGEGLGLDSIDILEVALVVSQRYGFQLRSDDEDNVRIFRSLASLAEHIAAQPPACVGRSDASPLPSLVAAGRRGLRRRLPLADDGRAALALERAWSWSGRCSACWRRSAAWRGQRAGRAASPRSALAGLALQAWRGGGLAPAMLYLAQHVAIHAALAVVFGADPARRAASR